MGRRFKNPYSGQVSQSDAYEADLFYRDLLGEASSTFYTSSDEQSLAASARHDDFFQEFFHDSSPEQAGMLRSPLTSRSSEHYDEAGGLPEDDEEAWLEFDAEFVEPHASPNGANAPFAPLLSATGYWPIITSHPQGRTVSYRTAAGAWMGRQGRSFGANRSNGTRYHVGVDLFGRFGDSVVAIEDGRIVSFFGFCCGKNKTSWALLVQHAQVVVNYGEVAPDSLSRNGLSIGSNVRAGQVIGRVGRNPGGSTMIHFETYTTGTTRSHRWLKGRTRPTRLLNPTRFLLQLQEQGLPLPAGGGATIPPQTPAQVTPGVVVHSCRPGEGPPAAVPDPQGRGLHPMVYRGNSRRWSTNPTVGDAQILLNRFLSGLSTGTYRCQTGADMSAIQGIRRTLSQDPLTVDCRFGSNTEKATKMFQRCVFPGQSREWDGKIGPNTWRELERLRTRTVVPPVSPPVSPPASPPGVRRPRQDWTAVGADQRFLYVMERLVRQYRYPVNGAAGIVGNLWAESGVLPNRIEGSNIATPMRARDFNGQMVDFSAAQVMNRNRRTQQGPRSPGIGLAQWTSAARRAGLFQHQFNNTQLGAAIVFDMDAQIDYLVNELQTAYRRVNRVLRAPGVTVNAASDEVVYSFEIPGRIIRDRRRLPRTNSAVQEVFAQRRRHSQRALRVYRAAHPNIEQELLEV